MAKLTDEDIAHRLRWSPLLQEMETDSGKAVMGEDGKADRSHPVVAQMEADEAAMDARRKRGLYDADGRRVTA